jgi:hypothetical protein
MSCQQSTHPPLHSLCECFICLLLTTRFVDRRSVERTNLFRAGVDADRGTPSLARALIMLPEATVVPLVFAGVEIYPARNTGSFSHHGVGFRPHQIGQKAIFTRSTTASALLFWPKHVPPASPPDRNTPVATDDGRGDYRRSRSTAVEPQFQFPSPLLASRTGPKRFQCSPSNLTIRTRFCR